MGYLCLRVDGVLLYLTLHQFDSGHHNNEALNQYSPEDLLGFSCQSVFVYWCVCGSDTDEGTKAKVTAFRPVIWDGEVGSCSVGAKQATT